MHATWEFAINLKDFHLVAFFALAREFFLYIHICENRCTLSPWTRFAWSVYITISFTLIYTWSIYSMWSIKPDSNHEFIDRSAVAKLSTNKIPVQTYITLHTPMDWHLQNRSIAHKKSPLFPGRFNYIQCFLGNGEREQTKKKRSYSCYRLQYSVFIRVLSKLSTRANFFHVMSFIFSYFGRLLQN